MTKSFAYSTLLSFALWTIPLILRIYWVEAPNIEADNEQLFLDSGNDVLKEISKLISEGNKQELFIYIFWNNIKGCILNILGGVLLGLGTLLSLTLNGFVFADIYVSSYNSGITISEMLKVTLPHSFELIGTWLSGALGFYIAWLIICFMRGKENFTPKVCRLIGMYSAIVVLIVLLAAYVEAFITSKQL